MIARSGANGMFRDVLVHVDGGAHGRRRASYATDLALRVGARLTGLHVTPAADPGPHYKPSALAAATARAGRKLAAAAADAAVVFRDEARRVSDARWLVANGDIASHISRHARYADIVVLGQEEWQEPADSHPLPVAHAVILRCGRPVIVVPAGAGAFSLSRIGIAWDASREAARAAHDALPLLRLAREVQIVTVIGSSHQHGEKDGDELLAHLTRHGVAVTSPILTIEAATEHEALRRHFEKASYDLVVMGGYSHPVWEQYVLGGATLSMLLSSKTPILASH